MVHPLLVELDRLVRRRTLSAIIITAGVALGVIRPAVWLSGRLAVEAQNLYSHATAMLANSGGIGQAQAQDWMAHSEWVVSLNRRPGGHIKLEEEAPKYAIEIAQVGSE